MVEVLAVSAFSNAGLWRAWRHPCRYTQAFFFALFTTARRYFEMTSDPPLATGKEGTPRRRRALPTLRDLRAEVEALDAARREGNLDRAGAWSLDQCCQHLGRWIEFSFDGFPFQYPWPYRLIGRAIRLVSWRWLVAISLRPGFLNPPSVKAVEPAPSIPDGEGASYLLRQLNRIESGERMTQPSPVEGRISHDQWHYFHLRHAELHLSFQLAQETKCDR